MLNEIFKAFATLVGRLLVLACLLFCPIVIWVELYSYCNNSYIACAGMILFYVFFISVFKGIDNYTNIKDIMKRRGVSYKEASEYYYNDESPIIRPED